MSTISTSQGAVCEILLLNGGCAKLLPADQAHMSPAQLQTGTVVGLLLLDPARRRSIMAMVVFPYYA